MDETSIDWIANEGARVSAIVADLKVAVGSHPLLKPVLDQEPPPALVTTEKVVVTASPALRADVWIEQSGDAASLVVPIRVPMPLFKKELLTAPMHWHGYRHGDGGRAYRPSHAEFAARIQA